MKIFKKWWWNSYGKYIHLYIYRGIKNIFKWLPIVWKDRDFDHSYILYALRFKIQNTANYIEKYKRYEGWERDVQKMRLCVRLFDALEKDIYESEYLEYYKTVGYVDEKEFYQQKVISDDLNTYMQKYPNYYRKLAIDPERRVWTALMIGHARNQKASDLLFELIKRNIYNWWD